jgi:hypothetical protein
MAPKTSNRGYAAGVLPVPQMPKLSLMWAERPRPQRIVGNKKSLRETRRLFDFDVVRSLLSR